MTKAFNVGRAEDSVQVRDTAEVVRDAVPASTVSFAYSAGPQVRQGCLSRLLFSSPNGQEMAVLAHHLQAGPGAVCSSRSRARRACTGHH